MASKKAKTKEISLPKGTKIPTHVAIIPDGNMRWAKMHGLSYHDGIDAGVETLFAVLELAQKFGIRYVTAWGLSTENWKRDPKMVAYIIKKVLKTMREKRNEYLKQGVRFRHLGSIRNLPKALVNEIRAFEKATKHCTKYYFNMAFNYGGRNEILRAVKKIVRKGYKTKEITEDLFSSMLDTAGLTEPDLIIRTSGEQRLSGLLPWQSVYAEFHFSKKLWPEFSKKDFRNAIIDYSNRDRRYGAQSSY